MKISQEDIVQITAHHADRKQAYRFEWPKGNKAAAGRIEAFLKTAAKLNRLLGKTNWSVRPPAANRVLRVEVMYEALRWQFASGASPKVKLKGIMPEHPVIESFIDTAFKYHMRRLELKTYVEGTMPPERK